jgi:hypothetical protein
MPAPADAQAKAKISALVPQLDSTRSRRSVLALSELNLGEPRPAAAVGGSHSPGGCRA